MANVPPLPRVYLDVCALSRPFDDQTQARIRLETEAVKLILSHVRLGHLELIASPAHFVEIAAIDDFEERRALERILRGHGRLIRGDLRTARLRAETFTRARLGPADSAHLALAEQANAHFVTVDDQLLKRLKRVELRVWAGTPMQFCERENLR